MKVLGLTGGIGCGKSTVAKALQGFGVPVVDADEVARFVVRPGSEGLTAVLAEFGTDVLAPDGTLDRKKLGALVFRDDERRKTLNGLLHPRIAQESSQRMFAHGALGHAFVVYEAALLVENGLQRGFEALIVVTAQPSVQRQRVLDRDGLAGSELEGRLRAQWPMAQKVAVAQFVVDNSGSLERLQARSRELYLELVLRFGPPHRG